jgi:hypothetical protein
VNRIIRSTLAATAAVALTFGAAATASAYPGQNAERGVFNASNQTRNAIAKVLDVEPRCIQVRQARADAAWAWVGPTYRKGCDHQLDDATMVVKGNDKKWREAGISGDDIYSCTLLKRNMELFVEDQRPKVQKRTQEAFRDFRAAGYCEKP